MQPSALHGQITLQQRRVESFEFLIGELLMPVSFFQQARL
jgi:hypothetical protein